MFICENLRPIKFDGGFMALNKDLLEILACPKCVRDPGCTGELEYREAENQLVCRHCRLIYRIEDDIPIMLIDEAVPLDFPVAEGKG